jgi:RimJ/RimL family protein N-acetyltransferase
LKAPHQFKTERLVLRKPATSDAEEIYRRYASDPEVTRYLGWPRHQSIDDTRTFIRFSETQWRDSPAGPYLIESGSGLLLGGTGLEFKTAALAMTGYVLARDAWGLGYATEALRAMIGLARQLEVRELRAFCHATHTASQRVLEKCGFGHEEDLVLAFPNSLPGDPGKARRYELVVV